MINKKFAEVLTALSLDINSGLSTANIFNVTKEHKDSLITDPESLSKLIYSIRGQKLITTSDGKVKVHQITTLGIRELNDFNLLVELEKEIEVPVNNAELATITYPLSILNDEIAELEVNEGFVLNMADDVENAMSIILSSMRELSQQKPALQIVRKSEKMATLSRLGALMSDDIKAVFDDIRHDLMQLDERAA